MDAARAYLERQSRALGLARSDVAEVVVSSEVSSRHTGVTHVYLQQRHRGLDVEGAIVNVNVAADGRVIGAGNRFVSGIASAAGGQTAHQGAQDAATSAAYHLGLPAVEPFQVVSHSLAEGDAVLLTDGGIAARPVEARLVWLPTGGSVVRLAWRVEIEERGGNHVWHSFVDAEKGTVLFHEDLVDHDDAGAIAAAVARPAGSPAAPDGPSSFGDIDGSTYRVFPYPFESPNDGDRALVAGAADPATSPFGWHDTNGVAGPEHTRTRGNNVHAYTDVDANGTPIRTATPKAGPASTSTSPSTSARRPRRTVRPPSRTCSTGTTSSTTSPPATGSTRRRATSRS